MATLILDKFLGALSKLFQGTCLSNLKSISLAVLEQLAFNAQKFTGVTWPWPRPLLEKYLIVVWTVPGNMPAKFEVRSFECIGSRQRSSVKAQNRWTQVLWPEIDRCQSLI